MEFVYNSNAPCEFEGWLEKANIGILERWQRRYFRIQGRCIYYFKKESGPDPPNGNIPLVDIKVTDIAPRKGHNFCFSINIQKKSISKRAEYFIAAENDATRKKWTENIMKNRSISIVGEPFQLSTVVSPSDLNIHQTLPYFFIPIIPILDSQAYKLRNIWTVEVPNEIVQKGLATLDFNYPLHTEDIHNVVAIILAYLRELPDGLLPSEYFNKFASKVTPEDLKELVRNSPAPVRQFLHDLGLHFKKVLDNTSTNGVTLYVLIPILGPILIRPPKGNSMVSSQVRSVQENVAQCFLQNATKILDDVHQFLDATRLPVIKRARVIESISQKSDEYLEASRGLLIHVVHEDNYGWCTVYTSNRRVGLMHSSNMKPLSKEDEEELNDGLNIDALMDVVREHLPQFMSIFDGMTDEVARLRDAFEASKSG
ncbi:Variant SH3 domain containing protein [Trichomonas vaginalis G3]|uniref:Variant SH3 domain containing protein n=1 Tax=Trichomonas vaginalis (strain ATCC PRA-98 / G3) TaxID=412133 RepID=A2E4C6_TRIV3|nr:GTPase activator protein [Trichomonas vaginalis G3]EAY12461.1 Variant SH3 domain containing protein [Trichomonas vaginalis G3]KAI5539524.1 GTPase activator protein [Trichomonas vaginalis G3]|eukprot:XP_001324684.1 Variant SH3 domain containing protein [Trichomonas vaginalis G3]